MTIGTDLDLSAMLERIVRGAVDLVDARQGALGVLDDSRRGRQHGGSGHAARGTFTIDPAAPTGTQVEWRVPLS